VVAADVTETAGMSLAPFAVAASLAELGNAVSVVVVGATHRERAQLVEALRLWAVDTVGQHDLQLASHRPSSGADMLVSFASGRGGPLAFESEVEAARTATVDDATATVLTVIVVSGRADEDARIVAFGAAVRAVVFVALGKSQRSAIHSVVDLADRSNCRVVGTVTVRRPSRRRRSKPTP